MFSFNCNRKKTDQFFFPSVFQRCMEQRQREHVVGIPDLAWFGIWDGCCIFAKGQSSKPTMGTCRHSSSSSSYYRSPECCANSTIQKFTSIEPLPKYYGCRVFYASLRILSDLQYPRELSGKNSVDSLSSVDSLPFWSGEVTPSTSRP